MELWKDFVNGKYDVYLSQVTLDEIEKCSESKRNKLYDYLSDIEYTKLEINAEIVELAQKIIDMGILRPKSFDDCQHIAAAVVNACDCIISWNFKHIVNIKTIRGVRAITDLEGYKGIDIVNPSVLLEILMDCCFSSLIRLSKYFSSQFMSQWGSNFSGIL